METTRPRSGWAAFWGRGGFWRAVLFLLVYIALYTGASFLSGAVSGDRIDTDDLFSSASSVFFALTLPLVIGSVVLALFLTSVRWWRPVFFPGKVSPRRWMWIAPVLVVIPIVLRLIGIDYGRYASGVVAVSLFSGLFIGFAEEVLTRGIVVKMLRDAGRSEYAVMLLSSLLFALLHTVNLLSGLSAATVAVTVFYTFAYGIVMYLTLRVTGSLVWPIVLHALFDPTQFLALGGIDTSTSGSSNTFLTLAIPFNIFFIVFALFALFLVPRIGRGDEHGGESHRQAPSGTLGS